MTMSIAVYPRLDELLEFGNVTISELESQIKERFDLTVDQAALYKLLLGEEPVKSVDLDIVAAVAAILKVPLGDLFIVATSSDDDFFEEEPPVLGPEDSRRMGELFDRSALSESERAELQGLVATYSRLLHERRVHEIAQSHGVSEDQVRRETEAAVAETLDWLRALDADPKRRDELAQQVVQRRVRRNG